MKRWSSLLLPLLVLLAAPVPAAAQDDMGTWFTVFQSHVPISDQMAYEEEVRGLISAFSDAGVDGVGWTAVSSSMMGYTYVMPGLGPSEYEAMGDAFGEAMMSGGDAAVNSMGALRQLTRSREFAFVTLRSDLSYKADDVPITADKPYRHFTELQVHPGHEEAFEASAKEWAASYEAHGVEAGWRMYEYHTGANLPRYLVVARAESEAAYHARSAEIDDMMGEDIDRLRAGTGPTLISVKEWGGWVRPDLSYPSSGGDTD